MACRIKEELKMAAKDKRIKAVILRINNPLVERSPPQI